VAAAGSSGVGNDAHSDQTHLPVRSAECARQPGLPGVDRAARRARTRADGERRAQALCGHQSWIARCRGALGLMQFPARRYRLQCYGGYTSRRSQRVCSNCSHCSTVAAGQEWGMWVPGGLCSRRGIRCRCRCSPDTRLHFGANRPWGRAGYFAREGVATSIRFQRGTHRCPVMTAYPNLDRVRFHPGILGRCSPRRGSSCSAQTSEKFPNCV